MWRWRPLYDTLSTVLTPYDDLPYHQIPTTFDHAGTADPRFFDRYWFVVYDRGGEVSLATGLGVYKNTNVCDGFAAVVSNGVQHNVRLSRALRPDFGIGVGPLRYEILEGLRRIRIILDAGSYSRSISESGIAFDLTFEASFPAFEEDHHFTRAAGVVTEDYRRYYQHGTASGTIEVGGHETRSDDFWSFRDRAFGVRPGMGGPMPRVAPDDSSDARVSRQPAPALYFGGAFGNEGTAGVCTWAEARDGTMLRLDGQVVISGTPVPVVGVEHDLRFHDHSVVAGGTVRYRLDDGSETLLELEEHGPPLVYPGFGYGDGYVDRLGLGAFRGPMVVETDRYDVAKHTAPVDLSGAREFGRSTLLDQPIATTVDGEPGFMELVAGLVSDHDRYRPAGAT